MRCRYLVLPLICCIPISLGVGLWTNQLVPAPLRAPVSHERNQNVTPAGSTPFEIVLAPHKGNEEIDSYTQQLQKEARSNPERAAAACMGIRH